MRPSLLFLLCGALVLAPALWGCSGQRTAESEMAEQEPPPMLDEPAPPPPPAPAAPAPAGATRPRTQPIPEERRAVTPPPQPATVTLTIPAGTQIQVSFPDTVTSETALAGDAVVATLKGPIVVGDRVVFPADSRVEGKVVDVKSAKKGFKDTGGAISITFHRLVSPGGRAASIQAGFTKVAEGSAGKKAGIIGGSAAGGALLGKVLGKDPKGAAVVGGAIGTAVAGSTKGKEAVIAPEDVIPLPLEQAARVTIPR